MNRQKSLSLLLCGKRLLRLTLLLVNPQLKNLKRFGLGMKMLFLRLKFDLVMMGSIGLELMER